jgi:hypothetical protein
MARSIASWKNRPGSAWQGKNENVLISQSIQADV